MNILFCNERFIFRYGVDRVLISLGKELEKRGHNISILANKFDKDVVNSFADKVIEIPSPKDYFNSEEYVYAWMNVNFLEEFKNVIPDIVFIAGWPFISVIPFFISKGIKVIFIDFGLVPFDGYSGGHLMVLKKLKQLRRKYLPMVSSIVGISDFITNSQSRIDSLGAVDTHSILLAADHLSSNSWNVKNVTSGFSPQYVTNLIQRLKKGNKKILLVLGRWEENCYKNSEAAYVFLRGLIEKDKQVALLTLADKKSIKIPLDLIEYVYPIGSPDDNSLKNIMLSVDLGLSFSLWEGFNLPLAEMQYLGKSVLVFNVAAHPEVVIDKFFLCADIEEMIAKVYKILFKGFVFKDLKKIVEYKKQFSWDRVVNEYYAIIKSASLGNYKSLGQGNKYIFFDVTNAARDPANTGVIRVARRLARELQNYREMIFVIWDSKNKCYVLPNKEEYRCLGSFNGPLLIGDDYMSVDERKMLETLMQEKWILPSWLIIVEIPNEVEAKFIRNFAKRINMKIAVVFHDAIPILCPEYCSKEINLNHAHYMRGLSETDLIFPNSKFSADCLVKFWQQNNLVSTKVETNLLPGEFAGHKRVNSPKQLEKKIKILCVSTLEPRKNHLNLIKACQYIEKTKKDLDFELVLVGNKYAGAMGLADKIIKISKKDDKIKYRGVVSDGELAKLYQEATFTVYPSIIEGFGMPILESIWYGLPCICNQTGVMSELAKEGGCLTVDVLDYKSLAESIYQLATDIHLYEKLSKQAISRPIKTWKDYADKFISILNENTDSSNFNLKLKHLGLEPWQKKLYKNCLCDNWQMNDSERLAMKAILVTIDSRCSVEVGTFKGGSLSLMSNYSKAVFSIDIDETVVEKFAFLKNVSFLTGDSKILLPILLNELDSQNIPVDFMLIDGDHSRNGIKSDLKTILNYIPKKPLFLLMHDSFNPECRSGMLDVSWTNCPYVHYVDLDFVPGRVIEYGGGQGEMWGGLAFAYFLPVERCSELVINKSANSMFEFVLNSRKK